MQALYVDNKNFDLYNAGLRRIFVNNVNQDIGIGVLFLSYHRQRTNTYFVFHWKVDYLSYF